MEYGLDFRYTKCRMNSYYNALFFYLTSLKQYVTHTTEKKHAFYNSITMMIWQHMLLLLKEIGYHTTQMLDQSEYASD